MVVTVQEARPLDWVAPAPTEAAGRWAAAVPVVRSSRVAAETPREGPPAVQATLAWGDEARGDKAWGEPRPVALVLAPEALAVPSAAEVQP